MNLCINLLLEGERRSSSRISRRFVVKTAAICAGLLFIALIVVSLSGARSAMQMRLFKEQEKKQLNQVYNAVKDLRGELNRLQDINNAISTWAQTRPDWLTLLVGIQAYVPPNIQLTRLTVNENIAYVDETPARMITLYFQGKAAGEHSETDVKELVKSLKEKAPFNDVMEVAQVKQFEAVKDAAGRGNMRVFDLECRLKIRKLYRPVKLAQPQETKPDGK